MINKKPTVGANFVFAPQHFSSRNLSTGHHDVLYLPGRVSYGKKQTNHTVDTRNSNYTTFVPEMHR